MSTAKARYVGDGCGDPIPDFSDALKVDLRSFYPDHDAKVDPVWGHPADDFVDQVLSEAWWAKSELHRQRFDTTRAEVRAEQADLLKVLQVCERKLRNLSPDVDRLLGVDADPRGCADQIALLIEHAARAGQAIEGLEKARKPNEKRHDVAIEMSLRVLRVLQQFGIRAAATGDSYFGYTSDAVKILKLIGDDIGIVRDELTWRDTIIKAKQQADDLQ